MKETPSAARYAWIPPETRLGRMGRLAAWVRGGSRPTWAVLVALGVGLAIGGVAFNASSLRPELEGVRSDLRGWQAVAGFLQQQVEGLEADNAELAGQISSLIAQLRAKRPIPELRGTTQEDVEALAHEAGWRLIINSRESDQREGTVLSQVPSAGTLMHLGARLTVVVARPLRP
ncbi:MAG: PASTA domain-containing protein [Actinomycetota bacterium]